MKIDLNQNFKVNSVRNWFNDNYFISLYDNEDNNLFSFNNIETASHFFNMKLCHFLRALRNGVIEYNNKRCKLYIYKKDKLDVIERGKCL
jgi:hypothetical protein